MWSDVVDLRDFYDSGLGQAARRMIRRRLRQFWPDLSGQRVLGIGYAVPFLWRLREEAERVLAAMPSSLGVLPWPGEGPGLTVLAEETELPFPDRSFDRILLVHALESTEQARGMMREIWRILADGGRLMVIAPNRRGIWARFDRTPFGQGQPYAPSQLNRLLRDTMFMTLQSGGALFMPPFTSRMILRSAPAWENLGDRWFPRFAGVLMVEAAKQLYAGTGLRAEVGRGAKRRVTIAVPQGFRQDP